MSMRYLTGTVILLSLSGTGCTYKAWYEGFQDTRRQECYRLPHGEVQSCLDNVNRVSYEQYRRERKEAQDEGMATEQTRTP
ncbi:MAG: hypothetical protein IPK65_08010 [Gammaproteobacteria bacterium]|nr:hypothetical protein [Gammaproteobacteria bacterium]